MFTTKDRDNDKMSDVNCATNRHGGWWYRKCAFSNLNGLYLPTPEKNKKGNYWFHWKNDYTTWMKNVEMKIRPF